jgi:hypothetical protein
MAVGVVGTFTACKKDEAPGTPTITYVRVTRPEASDSLLVGAGQGQLIAIVGENLKDAQEIWFNDQRAMLTPTYITNTSILVSVPPQIPTTVNNKLKIIFKNGYQLLYDFQVQISKPVVNSIACEYVNTGDIAILDGNYFYAPVTVTFTGGATGEVVDRKDNQLQVKVPAGAQAGPITIKTNFGSVTSTFWFRDNRNIIIDGDHFPNGGAEGWWGTYLVKTPDPTKGDPVQISGNYYRYKKAVKEWVWDAPEVAGGPANSMPDHVKSIPDDAILNPANYNVKFEINTLKPYNSNRISFNIGLLAEDNNAYVWQPPYDSKGQWRTVTIPYDEMVAKYATKPTVSATGYWNRILIFGPGDLDADICFDNLRIVPKK